MRPRSKGLETIEPEEKKFYSCFVCDEKSTEKGISLLIAQTAFSRIPLGEKLQEILGSKYLVLTSFKDRICWDCASCINWIDKYEHKIDLMKEYFIDKISSKYKKIEVCLNEKSDEVLEPLPIEAHKTQAKPNPQVHFELNESKDEIAYKGRRRKEYTCKYCGKEYVSLVSLTMHIQRMHAGREVCEDCGMRFETKFKLKKHMKLKHLPTEKELTCVSCGFHTTNTEIYCRHVCNSSIVSLTCITCNKRYVDSNFREDAGTYQCQACQAELTLAQPELEDEEEEEEELEKSAEPPPPPSPPPPLHQEISGSELAAEMPEFFREPELREEDKHIKNEENECNSYLRCEGCGEQFKLSDLTQHPCFIRGDAVEFVEVEPPFIGKKTLPGSSLLQCKTCSFQFANIEALRSHWDLTGHLREVSTGSVELNKIRDRFKKTEATFKVVKQNFNIRATRPGENEEALRIDDNYKDMFVRISDNKIDPFEDFERSNGKGCGTCGITFPNSELLANHQKNDCLTCITCNISFYDNKLLKKHYLFTGHASKLRLTMSPPRPFVETRSSLGFKCHRCVKTFQSRFLLRKHFQVHYRGTERGACQYCLLEFENKNDIQQHVLEAHGAQLYKCSHCERTFMSDSFRNRHEAKHKAPIPCKTCNLKFTNQKSLILHFETYHQGSSCRLCGKLIDDPIALRRHERRHYFDKELECDICKKRFRSKMLLVAHSKLHTADEIKFQCKICQLGFNSEETLKEHQLSHAKPGKYKCHKCNLTYDSKAHFWMHTKTHEACYVCSVCNRSFRDTSLLAIHRRKHWRVRPYQCPQCHRAFSVPATLRRHLHVHTRMYPHRCGICKKGFLTRHAYYRHTDTVHAVTNSFPQRRPNIPSLPLNATDEDIFQAADTLIADDSIMFNEYPNKEMEQTTSTDLITNEVVVETTELFDEILH